MDVLPKDTSGEKSRGKEKSELVSVQEEDIRDIDLLKEKIKRRAIKPDEIKFFIKLSCQLQPKSVYELGK